MRRARLCRIFRCTPSQLNKENWDDIEVMSAIYEEAAKEDPLTMFM